MTRNWLRWLKGFWIVSSPETFAANCLYVVLKQLGLHNLLELSTYQAVLVVFWVNPTLWLSLQWALTLVLLVTVSHLVHSRNLGGGKTFCVNRLFIVVGLRAWFQVDV